MHGKRVRRFQSFLECLDDSVMTVNVLAVGRISSQSIVKEIVPTLALRPFRRDDVQQGKCVPQTVRWREDLKLLLQRNHFVEGVARLETRVQLAEDRVRAAIGDHNAHGISP
jgi:hypothetical protein